MNGIEKSKKEIQEAITELAGLHTHKIRNIYLYGSRVYGTYTINSDYDIIVVACSMYVNKEIFDGTYNIHITTPDSFMAQLRQHDIHCLECIFAPDDAIIQAKIDYNKNFRINIGRLKKMLLSQSYWAWSQSQRRIEKGNIVGGSKSLFHSLRILKFGMQIMKFGKIVDFSEANDIWNKLNDCNALEWEEYQDIWLPVRKGLMKEFKGANIGGTGISHCSFGKFKREDLVPLADIFEKVEPNIV